MLEIAINKTCAQFTRLEVLTSGMVGATIKFVFSADWDGLNKTAVFTNGETSIDVLNVVNECIIPHEVLAVSGKKLKIGVYGTNGSTIVIPTVYAETCTIKKGADPSGDESTEPSLPVWAQIQSDVNDLDTRVTELEEHGGGGIPDAPIDGKQYARQNGEWTEVQSASGQGWTDEQIDLLESIFGKLVYTDAQGGQFARALIASLRSEEPSEYEVSFADGVLTITKAPATQSGAVLTIN